MAQTTDRRLLLGPPAAGLTARILGELAEMLGDPAVDPRRLLVIVPNHAAVQNCVRRLQQRRDLPAIPECIVPLSKLPHHWGHIAPGRALPPMLGTLFLRAALEEVEIAVRKSGGESLLPAYRPGVLSAVGAQIHECKQAGFLPATVAELEWTEAFAHSASRFPWTSIEKVLNADNAKHRLRLLDQFRQVWIAYERRLHRNRLLSSGDAIPGWLDSADQLLAGATAFEHQAPQLDWLAVDGFTEFTALQWRLLQPLLSTPLVRFTLPVDRLDGPLFDADDDPRRWFSAILNQDRFFAIEEVPAHPEAPLATLHRVLPQVTSGMPLADSDRQLLEASPGLRLRQPADRAREVASVLRDIVRRVQSDPSMRYRDHVLIVRNLDAYRPLLEAEADALQIPLRILHARPLSSHPLGQCWERATQLLTDPEWTRDAVLGVLQPLAISAQQFDALGHFQVWLATKSPASTPHAWRTLIADFPDTAPPLIDQDPAPLLDSLRLLLDAWKDDGQSTITIVVRWLIEALLPAWLAIADPEDPDSGAAATALCEVASMLLSLDEQGLLGEAGMDVGHIIGLALAETTYEPKDNRREALRVADAERARDLEAEHVAILGLTLGNWPRRPSPQPFFDDPLRTLLSEYQRSEGSERRPRAEAWTRPDWHTEATSSAIEGWLFRVACGRARSHLTLSAPMSDNGTAQEPSPWFATLLPKIVAGALRLTGWEQDQPGQRLVPFAEWTIVEDAATWLACYRHVGITGRPRQAIATRHAIAQLGVGDSAGGFEHAAVLASILEAHAAIGGAVADAASRWPGAPRVLPVDFPQYHRTRPSPSSLNDLAQCAFKHFAQRVCGLVELAPPLAAGLDPMKRGTVIHAALEHWTRAHPDLDPSSLLDAFAVIWHETVHEADSALYGPQRAAMSRRLSAFAEVEASGWPWSRVRTEAELSFGRETPLALALPDGREFTYTGSIDRLDTVDFHGQPCLVLMDYKNSKATLKSKEDELLKALAGTDEEESEYGESAAAQDDITLLAADVQLPLYAYAASQLRQLPVLAAFHYPLGNPSGRVHAFLPGSGSWKIGDWSAVDPSLTLATPAQWRALTDQLAARIAELFARLEERDIHPEPLYIKRCGPGRCDYARLCRYDDMPARSRW